jgi:hypothetical protein
MTRSSRFRRVMESLRIRNERGLIAPLIFSDSQEILWKYVAPRLDEHLRLWFICLKGRQTYTSTFFEALMFARTIEQPGTNSLVLAQDLDTSQAIFNMVKLFHRYLPLPVLRAPKVKELIFPFPAAPSVFRVISAGVSMKGRGTTQTCVHSSEGAFWPQPEVLTGLFQGMPDVDDTMWVMESTANGMVGTGEMFYKEWQRATSGDSYLTPIFIPWFVMPKYRGSAVYRDPLREDELDTEEKELFTVLNVSLDALAWRRYAIKTKCSNSIELFHQEYPSCLVAGTRVATTNGNIKIECIGSGEQTPYGKIDKVIIQQPARCVRLTTRSGIKLDATWHHPMVIRGSDILIPASATLGKELVLASPVFTDTHYTLEWSHGITKHQIAITPELALFLGYFMGDGYFCNGRLSVVCTRTDSEVVNEIESLLRSFGLSPQSRVVGTKSGGTEVRASGVWLKETLTALGAVRRTEGCNRIVRSVCVPECIWRSPREVIRVFLSGLFEADGFSNKAQWDVRLFTNYLSFARDIQQLLLLFGIHADVRHEGRGGNVQLRGVEAKRFHDLIGFRSTRKRSAIPKTTPQSMRGARLEVVSIEELGDLPSYDLSISERPVFGANGLLVHNTPSEAFISTGLPAFDRLALMQQRSCTCPPTARGRLDLQAVRDSKIKTPVFIEDPSGEVRIWKFPEPDHRYVIGADTAEGYADKDASCGEVIDMATLEQVACIHGAIAPREFASGLNALGKWYNNALLAVEVNNHGHACMDHLIRTFMYPNLHLWRGRSDRIRPIQARYYGWDTNSWSRPLLIEAGRRCIDGRLVVIHEEKLIDELYNFSRQDNGKYSASAGHDDRVLAFLIALRSREENYFPAARKVEMSDQEIQTPHGVRVVEALEDRADTRKRVARLLKKAAMKKGQKRHWTEY